MISLILLILAAICNSIMDNITHHYYKSVFKKYSPKFWNPSISSDIAKMYFSWKYDAWHVFKSLMIILLCCSICVYKTLLFNPAIDFILFGITWNCTFNLFYNHLLNKNNDTRII